MLSSSNKTVKILFKFFTSLFIVLGILFAFPLHVSAVDNTIYIGTITSISRENCLTDVTNECENAKVLLTEEGNKQSSQSVQLKTISKDVQDISVNYKVGDKIQIKKVNLGADKTYLQAIAVDASDQILYLTAILVLLVVLVSRWKGVQSIIALALTTWGLFGFLLPYFQKNPDNILTVGILTCFVFLFLNLIVGHGWNIVSWISFASSAASFAVSILFSLFTLTFFRLNGLGSDGSLFLASSGFTAAQLSNLFLIGIFLAVTGALDDVTSAQSAAIKEIAIAKNGASWSELFKQGYVIGQEHLVSMINTLVLAFAGASLPVFLSLYLQNQTNIWYLISRADVLEEIIRSLLASLTLVLAIPLTAALASFIFSRIYSKKVA
jgi:uncharacterized membrane protein